MARAARAHWYPNVHPIAQPKARLRRVTSQKVRRQPRGYERDVAKAALDVRINARAREEAAHLGVSKAWLIATILADAFRIDLDKKLRAFK